MGAYLTTSTPAGHQLNIQSCKTRSGVRFHKSSTSPFPLQPLVCTCLEQLTPGNTIPHLSPTRCPLRPIITEIVPASLRWFLSVQEILWRLSVTVSKSYSKQWCQNNIPDESTSLTDWSAAGMSSHTDSPPSHTVHLHRPQTVYGDWTYRRCSGVGLYVSGHSVLGLVLTWGDLLRLTPLCLSLTVGSTDLLQSRTKTIIFIRFPREIEGIDNKGRKKEKKNKDKNFSNRFTFTVLWLSLVVAMTVCPTVNTGQTRFVLSGLQPHLLTMR